MVVSAPVVLSLLVTMCVGACISEDRLGALDVIETTDLLDIGPADGEIAPDSEAASDDEGAPDSEVAAEAEVAPDSEVVAEAEVATEVMPDGEVFETSVEVDDVADSETSIEVEVDVDLGLDETTTDSELGPETEVTAEVIVDPGPDLPALHRKIDGYLDRRFDASPAATIALVAAIASEGATIDQVETMLRVGRADYPDVQATIGQTTEVLVVCQHVDYTSTYLLSVPASYDPALPTPLVFVASPAVDGDTVQDARASAADALAAYGEAMHGFGAIVVAPVTTRGWSPIADSMILTIVSDLQRRYHLDPNKVYVAGRGAGGHMAWRASYTLTDHWAAVSPASGGYDTYLLDNRLRNLYGTHGVQLWSDANSTFLRGVNADISAFLAEAGYDWEGGEFQTGTLAIPPDSMTQIATLFARVRRNPYARAVYFWGGGSMRYDTNWSGQIATIDAERAYRWNQKHWLEVTPNVNPGLTLDVFASVLDDHTIVVTANNVRALRIHLHPAMGLDFGKPLQVFVNDVLRYDGPISEDLSHLLEVVREWDDRGRIYRGYVDITVPTDRTVPMPLGQP